MKGIPNMGNLMKQAQQFQNRMAKLQQELEAELEQKGKIFNRNWGKKLLRPHRAVAW